MSEVQDQLFLTTAASLAERASAKILELHANFSVQAKNDSSPVTEADFASDRIIREGLKQAFPQHAILTEESGLEGDAHAEWIWVIDPLDGTKAYVKKIPGFCVMMGLLRWGEPYLGVVKDPITGYRYEAIQGRGAFLIEGKNRKKLQVSARRDFAEMPLVVSTGFPQDSLDFIQEKFQFPLLPPINSVGIKVGLLVRQQGDVYLNHHSVHYWDTCAPQIILQEAGGLFTRLDGAPLRYELDGHFSHHSLTLASHGLRHTDLVKSLSKIDFSK